MNTTVKALEHASLLVTGGTSGIGLAIAAAFLEAGVDGLVVNGRNKERGAEAVRHLRAIAPSATIAFIAADVTIAAQATHLVDEARAELGSLDVLVNCAGGDHAPELLHEIEIERVAAVLNHYILGTAHVSRCVLPYMMAEGGGVIINVASDAGRVPTPGACLNGAAMAANIMFSRTLAVEAKRSGVRIHALTPSIVSDTRTFDRVMKAGFSERLFAKAISRASLGVVGPDDVALVAVFLASPAASKMTGQVISVNGGISVAT